MARTHLSIRVELVSGGGRDLWPRPGRLFVAARRHTFDQLARAVDVAFARWDRAHLHTFDLADDLLLVGPPGAWDDEPQGRPVAQSGRERLSRLSGGEQFAYTFDLGDDWAHLCTVGPERADPLEVLGTEPAEPTAYWGWGDLPDQYGRRWDGDHGESAPPAEPRDLFADLPPLQPHWGPRRQ